MVETRVLIQIAPFIFIVQVSLSMLSMILLLVLVNIYDLCCAILSANW